MSFLAFSPITTANCLSVRGWTLRATMYQVTLALNYKGYLKWARNGGSFTCAYKHPVVLLHVFFPITFNPKRSCGGGRSAQFLCRLVGLHRSVGKTVSDLLWISILQINFDRQTRFPFIRGFSSEYS